MLFYAATLYADIIYVYRQFRLPPDTFFMLATALSRAAPADAYAMPL